MEIAATTVARRTRRVSPSYLSGNSETVLRYRSRGTISRGTRTAHVSDCNLIDRRHCDITLGITVLLPYRRGYGRAAADALVEIECSLILSYLRMYSYIIHQEHKLYCSYIVVGSVFFERVASAAILKSTRSDFTARFTYCSIIINRSCAL